MSPSTSLRSLTASHSHTPISPPAPHRRAPRPPTYRPRRPRSRHMLMREPAGLFTVCEVDEASTSTSSDRDSINSIEYPSSLAHVLSAKSSSELLNPSPRRTILDMPCDIEDDVAIPLRRSVEGIHLDRLGWEDVEGEMESEGCPSASTGQSSQTTSGANSPMELDDPFIFDKIDFPPPAPLSISNLQALNSLESSSTIPTTRASRYRRPPPLDLSRQHPFRSSSRLGAAPANKNKLLPALPILPPRERTSPTTPRAKASRYRRSPSPNDPVDLVSALEELLASCGEELPYWSDSEKALEIPYDAFPLPPGHPSPSTPLSEGLLSPSSISLELRTPRTPEHRISRPGFFVPPSPGSPSPCDRERVRPNFKGDHGFLQSLSMGTDSPVPSLSASSTKSSISSASGSPAVYGGSTSSRRGLPQRKQLPAEWMTPL